MVFQPVNFYYPMARKNQEPKNLYELKPRRLVDWAKGDNNGVTLLVPKFRKGLLARWLQPRLRRPLFKINLDEFGSFVWLRSDGEKDVRRIGEEMRSAFGEAAEPIYDRISRFLQQLEHSEFIAFSSHSQPPNSK